MVKEDVVYVECRERSRSGDGRFPETEHSGGSSQRTPGGRFGEVLRGTGNEFLLYLLSKRNSHTAKFGLEAINGATRGFPFDVKQLQAYANKAAEVLNVPVYGGDCVVSATGEIRIIDFNDWPSFARCREEAGPEIAKCIYNRIIHKLEK